MQTVNNILLVRVPETKLEDLRALRDFILESLVLSGLLVLPEDVTLEVMELPTLSGVEIAHLEGAEIPSAVRPAADAGSLSSVEAAAEAEVVSQHQPAAEEKQAILQRLKAYRDAHGLGSLENVSQKTARNKAQRLSADILRMVLTGDTTLPMDEWMKIGRALDLLEVPDPC